MFAELVCDGERVLHNTEPGHNKFYVVRVSGREVITSWGRIGATGQSKTQPLANGAAALKAGNKTLREKLNKGYVPVGGALKRGAEQPLVAPVKLQKKPVLGLSVTLAESWDASTSKVSGWMCSEKLDGIRAVWKAGTFWTRTGNEIHAPPSMTAGLPFDVTLDGELWAGRGNANFNRVSGLVRSLNPREAEWEGVTFMVFDAPDVAGGFERRLAAIPSTLGNRAVKVAHTLVCSAADVWEQHASVTALGGEGLMLRDPVASYAHGRSRTLLKVKKFFDMEAVVAGYNWSNAKPVCSLLCRMPTGDEFSCTVSAAVKAVPPALGACVTVKYFELTAAGVPRFPSYVGERTDL